MNRLQQEVIDFIMRLKDNDSIPLFFAESKIHKQFQWALMQNTTYCLWDQICGLTEEKWEASFDEWLKDQKN